MQKVWRSVLSLFKSIPFTVIVMALGLPLLKRFGVWGAIAGFFSGFFQKKIQSVEDAIDSTIQKTISTGEVGDGLKTIEGSNDQREMEDAIGSVNAGKPAVHRDGVQECRTLDCD